MNRKKVAALKAAALAALVLFVAWPLLRAMTSTPGVVRIATNSPNLINALNTLGGAEYVQSNFFLSDAAIVVTDFESRVFGVNPFFLGVALAYGPAGSDEQAKAGAHEALHMRGYLESKAPGDIMNKLAVSDGTAAVSAQQAADLADLSGASVYQRAYWLLRSVREEARRRKAAQEGIGEVMQ